MADVTRNSYDPNKQYVSVIYQRGKDVADAELNEMQDITRAFAAYGAAQSGEEGAYDNSALLVASNPTVSEVTIKAGSFFCEGSRYVLAADSDLLTLTGATAPTNTSGSDRYDALRVQFTQFEVDGATDPDIVYPPLGETTRRFQMLAAWVYDEDVDPAAELAAIEAAGPVTDLMLNGNIREFTLAYILRRDGINAIRAQDITDVRQFAKSVQIAQQTDMMALTTALKGSVSSGSAYVACHDACYIKSKNLWVISGTQGTSSSAANVRPNVWLGSNRMEFGSVGLSATVINYNRLFSVASNLDGTMILAVGGNGRTFYSTDFGANWTDISPAAIAGTSLSKVIFDGTDFYAVGSNNAGSVVVGNGVIVQITDPTIAGGYTVRHTGTSNTACYDIVYTGTHYIACGQNGRTFDSSDGITFTERSVIHAVDNRPVMGIAYDSGDVVRAIQALGGGTGTGGGGVTAGVDIFVWESTDNGVTWEIVGSYAATTSITGATAIPDFEPGACSFDYLLNSRLWVASGNAQYAVRGGSITPLGTAGSDQDSRLVFDRVEGGVYVQSHPTLTTADEDRVRYTPAMGITPRF